MDFSRVSMPNTIDTNPLKWTHVRKLSRLMYVQNPMHASAPVPRLNSTVQGEIVSTQQGD